MATSKTTKKSLQSEGKTVSKPKKTQSAFKRNFNPTAPTIFKLTKSSTDFNGEEKFPLIVMIKPVETVFDPETNSNRKIQYVEGESSIWADEQADGAKPRGTINFNKGYLMVPHTNPTLRRYLNTSNYNSKNPHRMTSVKEIFSLIDYQDDSKKKIDSAKLSAEATSLALTMPLAQLLGYAKVLGVNIDKTTEEIRWDMKLIADKNPQEFIQGLNDPRTEMKQVIMMAAEYGIISLGKGHVKWDNGNIICSVPIGVTPEDRMLDFSLEGEGEAVYEEIERRLESANS